MTDVQAQQWAERLVTDTFLDNENGWREWYALVNSGKDCPPPNGMAQRLVDRIAAELLAVQRECADKVEVMAGKAHVHASENADVYYAYIQWVETAIKAIRGEGA